MTEEPEATAAPEERQLALSKTGAGTEIRRRAPWMIVGLAAGIFMVAMGRHFEEALAARIELVFFLPMIVYMSDIIGTETLSLVVREIALRGVKPQRLLWRELRVGTGLGLASGVPMGAICYLWLGDAGLAFTVGLAMIVNGVVAVIMGMLIPVLFAKLRRDPAIGSEEITTALSDLISMFVYLVVASAILLS